MPRWQFLILFMSRAFVFIDGSNFYFKLKELVSRIEGKFSLLEFLYYGFAEWLVQPNSLIEVHYYIASLKRQGNEKSEQMYADQQKLLRKLQQYGIHLSFGQLIRHPDHAFHEKGVDVRLAVEMIRFARENRYDIGYLVSSDTDLVPAIEEVQSFGKKVQYVGIAKGQSFGLTKVSNDVRLLRPEDIAPFLSSSLV